MFFKKLERAEDRYREIEQLITLPEVVSDNKEYSKIMKEYKALTPIVEKFREYRDTEKQMKEAAENLDFEEAIRLREEIKKMDANRLGV